MSEELLKFYADVDAAAKRLADVHADRLKCAKGCSSCCVDGITVFEIEADNIKARHADLLSEGAPHPEGACAFLDSEGACRIYENRPYVCRTQGLPLRWIEEEAKTFDEYRDICPLNDIPDEPLEDLPENECWTIGDFEGRLATLQISRSNGEPKRVHLRTLFKRKA